MRYHKIDKIISFGVGVVVQETEWKVRAHVRNCEKDLVCILEQHFWNTSNIFYFLFSDLNS